MSTARCGNSIPRRMCSQRTGHSQRSMKCKSTKPRYKPGSRRRQRLAGNEINYAMQQTSFDHHLLENPVRLRRLSDGLHSTILPISAGPHAMLVQIAVKLNSDTPHTKSSSGRQSTAPRIAYRHGLVAIDALGIDHAEAQEVHRCGSAVCARPL